MRYCYLSAQVTRDPGPDATMGRLDGLTIRIKPHQHRIFSPMFGLESIRSPVPVDDFLDNHCERSACHIKGDPEKFDHQAAIL
jgi:hypothetical protein